MAEDIVYRSRPRYDYEAEAVKSAQMQRRMRDYNAAYDAGPARRENWDVRDYNWASPGMFERHGTTAEELQQAYGQLSDADRIRAGYMGPTRLLQMAGMREMPAPGSGFGGAHVQDPRPAPAPPSPFDPSYDPLPPPAVLPPEDPPVAPAPPPPAWVEPPAAPPIAQPPAAPPIAEPPVAPPVTPPTTPPAPSPGGQVPTPPGTGAPGGATGGVGPGPFPPYLGGQATWGNPTDPHLLPFSPGSILPPGQGGNPPAWWNEIIQPSPLAPPGFPTTVRNPYFGNTGGFNVGSPYYAPMSTWGFYPMTHMAQHMPGSFGMVTPGMGSWYTGSPVGFNPTPGTGFNGGLNNMPGMRAAMPAMGAASSGGAGSSMQPFYGNMAGVQTMQRPAWMNYGGMFVGGQY